MFEMIRKGRKPATARWAEWAPVSTAEPFLPVWHPNSTEMHVCFECLSKTGRKRLMAISTVWACTTSKAAVGKYVDAIDSISGARVVAILVDGKIEWQKKRALKVPVIPSKEMASYTNILLKTSKGWSVKIAVPAIAVDEDSPEFKRFMQTAAKVIGGGTPVHVKLEPAGEFSGANPILHRENFYLRILEEALKTSRNEDESRFISKKVEEMMAYRASGVF